MVAKKFQLNISGFTDGLNTEASVLNVLPSEFMDGSTNVELLHNASAQRRRGVDFVGPYTTGTYLYAYRTESAATDIYQDSPSVIYVVLTAPNGDPVTRIIADINNEFWVYEGTRAAVSAVNTPYQTISRGTNSFSLQRSVNMQFKVSGDKVYFTGKYCQPGYLQVASDNVSLEAVFFDVIIRDTAATAINTRIKRSINGVERWYDCLESHTSTAALAPGDGTGDWQRYWYEHSSGVPSGLAAWAVSTDYTSNLIKLYDKNTTLDATTTRPTTVEFFAGRVWLAGDPSRPGDVFFSNAYAKASDLTLYMQIADPFNTADSDLVDSDGGVIRILGAGRIVRMISEGTAMFIASTQGVWQVTGSSDSPFKATQHFVSKVLSDGVYGVNNLIVAKREVIIFGASDLWISSIERSLSVSTSGIATFKSLVETNNSELWRTIPPAQKAAAHTVYDSVRNHVHFFYNGTRTAFENSYGSLNQPGYVREALVFDLAFNSQNILEQVSAPQTKRHVKNAFFKYTYTDDADDGNPYITAPFVAEFSDDEELGVISLDGSTVVDAALDTVVAQGEANQLPQICFLALSRSFTTPNVVNSVAFGDLRTTATTDWSSDAAYTRSYDSRLVLGVQTMGDVMKAKSGLYMFFVFKKVESGTIVANEDTTPGGCFLRTAWQWSTSATSSKYGSQQQVYHPNRYPYATESGDDGFDHTWYKHRVRGRGNALQVIIENDGDKDFHLIGWTHQFGASQ